MALFSKFYRIADTGSGITHYKSEKENTTNCACCGAPIKYSCDEVYHTTAVINGKLNKHIHLCNTCFMDKVKSIPVIKT